MSGGSYEGQEQGGGEEGALAGEHSRPSLDQKPET